MTLFILRLGPNFYKSNAICDQKTKRNKLS